MHFQQAPKRRAVHVFMRDMIAYLPTDTHFAQAGVTYRLLLTGKHKLEPSADSASSTDAAPSSAKRAKSSAASIAANNN